MPKRRKNRLRLGNLAETRWQRRVTAGLVVLGAAFVLALPVIMIEERTENASAYNPQTCLNRAKFKDGTRTDEVPSVIHVCEVDCKDQRGIRWGALWISNTGAGSNIVKVNMGDSKKTGKKITAKFAIFGQVYSCGSTNRGMTSAYHMEIRDLNNRKIDEIKLSKQTMHRGVTTGKTDTWTTGGKIANNKITDVEAFFHHKDATCIGEGTIIDPNDPNASGEYTETCTRKVKVYRCFRTNGGCGSSISKVKGVLHYTVPPDDDHEEQGTGNFESTSTVEIPAQGSDVGEGGEGYKLTSNADGKAKIKFSTDETSVTVNFWHTLKYASPALEAQDYYVPSPEVNWRIRERHKDKESDKYSAWSDSAWDHYNTMSGEGDETSELDDLEHETVTVTFDPDKDDGVTKTVCRRIAYRNKNISYWKDWYSYACGYMGMNTCWDYDWRLEGPDYTSSDAGHSEACAAVTYINDSTTDESYTKTGTVDNDVVFVGEETAVTFFGKANTYEARRLAAKEAAVYTYDVNIPYNEAILQGNTRAKQAKLCEYLNSLASKPQQCVVMSDEDLEATKEFSVGEEGNSAYEKPAEDERNTDVTIQAIVPDTLGWKYCASYAYKFQYWVNFALDDVKNWRHEKTKDYNYVVPAACKAIAKKPSMAVWNSGLGTNGGLVTLLSKRHQNPLTSEGPALGDYVTEKDIVDGATEDETPAPDDTSGETEGCDNDEDCGFAEDDSDGESSENVEEEVRHADGTVVTNDLRKLYGSWSEFLAVIGGKMSEEKGIASGSTLAKGSLETKLCSDPLDLTNSPLTISNVGCNLGESGVATSSAYRKRLDTYLKSLTGAAVAPSLPQMGIIIGNDIRVSETRVYHATDDLTIDKNIVVVERPYPNIYELPQAIIFVDGDVKIKSNVERIDAWIIATGKINTCSDYVNRETAGLARLWNGVLYNPDTVCSKRLTFNGPVLAGQMLLNRSAGSDARIGERQDPAEVFNLRADAYLWGYAQAGRYSSSYSETYVREIAPRY